MKTANGKDARKAIGRAPERLPVADRVRLAGKHIALEVYTPETLPLRRIEAIGDSLDECVRMLRERGLNPAHFEFSLLPPPF